MQLIKIPSTNQYHDLYPLSGITQGTSLIITNNTNGQIRLVQADTPPPPKSKEGFPVWPNETVLVHGNDIMPVYVKGGTDGRIIVQELTSTVTPFTGVEFAQDIVTSGVEGFRRLQVDVAETGFFEGREFRTVRKIRLATGETKVYKFTCLNDFILFSLIFTVSAGNYEVHIWDGANLEETVLSTDPVPIYLKNYSGEFRLYDGDRYQSQTTITTGGSIAVNDPEQYLDYVEMITANATAQRATVGQSTGSKRYLPGSAVFFVEIFAINGPVRGTISSDWEERPPGVK